MWSTMNGLHMRYAFFVDAELAQMQAANAGVYQDVLASGWGLDKCNAAWR